VNSINWARVLAQVVYYFYAAFRVMKQTGTAKVRFSVPTGNFGDIFAGYVAARMGLPISRLVLATNENDILARFFNTGEYSQGAVHATLSPSMDIQVASNFERYLFERSGCNAEALKAWMAGFVRNGVLRMELVAGGGVDPLFLAGSADTAATLETIRRVYETHGYLLDPHTAVGVHVAAGHRDKDEPMICLATAHPSKFGDAVLKATGRDLAHHPVVDALAGLPTRKDVLPASVEAVQTYMEDRLHA
jgi:threonine synthase